MTTPPANWYPDPQQPGLVRYWDGNAWTEHTSPAPQQEAAPHGGSQPPGAAPKRKGLGVGWIIAIVLGAFALVVGVLAAAAVPVFLEQRAKAHDSAAKSDVATLARDLATYFVDLRPGDAPPAVYVDNGTYVIDGSLGTRTLETVSPEVEFGGADIEDYATWCVWVTAPGGDVKDFQYSAAGGLEPGTCS